MKRCDWITKYKQNFIAFTITTNYQIKQCPIKKKKKKDKAMKQ